MTCFSRLALLPDAAGPEPKKFAEGGVCLVSKPAYEVHR